MRLPGKSESVKPLLLLIPLLAGCAGNDLPVDAAPETVLAHAERQLVEEDYYDAAQTLEFFLRSHPGTAMTALARLRLGDARYGLGEYVLAEGDYQQVVADFPASPHVEEARFKIARCSYASILPYDLDQTETERAVGLLEEFHQDYPASAFLPEAEAALADCRERLAHGEFENGRFYRDRRRYKPAAIQFKYVIEHYPDTPWAPRAALELAGMYALRERWEEAEQWYRRVQTQWPGTQEAGQAQRALAALPEGGALSRLPSREGER